MGATQENPTVPTVGMEPPQKGAPVAFHGNILSFLPVLLLIPRAILQLVSEVARG
jgi:hypothetical protein